MEVESNNISVPKLVRQQRNFLHDLSSPLMIAMGMASLMEDAMDAAEDDPTRIKMAKVTKALGRMSELLKEERKRLVSLGVEEP